MSQPGIHGSARDRSGQELRSRHESDRSAIRARALILGGSLAVLGTLLLAWLYVRSMTVGPPLADRPSVLEVGFDEPEFTPQATAAQLLELADRQIQKLLEVHSDSAHAWNVKASRDYLVSDTAAARESWKRAIELDPLSSEALFGLAMLDFEEGRYQSSIALCEDLVRLDPSNPKVPLLLADAYMHDAQAEKAVLTLEQHITTAQSSVQALEMLGNAYLNLQDYAQAAKWYQSALGFAPDSKDSHYGLAQALARLGNREQATVHRERFDELARASGATHSGDAQAFLDRDFAAHVAAQVYVDSALVLKQAGDLAAAEDNVLRAQQLQPDVVAWLEELQRLFAAQQKTLEAIDVGERLVALLPDSVDHWLILGQLYAEVQRAEPAVAAYRKAIEIAPDDSRCQRAQSIIRRLQES